MRSVAELISEDDAWPALRDAIDNAPVACASLPSNDPLGVCLYSLQVTTRSVLGAMAFHTGGLLIDHGWVRLFGSGHDALPSLATANSLPADDGSSPAVLLLGLDVLGGKFAVNGGGLKGAQGEVNFWAPETLAWESLGIGHGDFVHWLVGGGSTKLYESLRWPGWEAEVQAVGLGQGLMLYPPPCTVEGQDTSRASRRAVPRDELDYWLASLAEMPDGPVRINVVP